MTTTGRREQPWSLFDEAADTKTTDELGFGAGGFQDVPLLMPEITKLGAGVPLQPLVEYKIWHRPPPPGGVLYAVRLDCYRPRWSNDDIDSVRAYLTDGTDIVRIAAMELSLVAVWDVYRQEPDHRYLAWTVFHSPKVLKCQRLPMWPSAGMRTYKPWFMFRNRNVGTAERRNYSPLRNHLGPSIELIQTTRAEVCSAINIEVSTWI